MYLETRTHPRAAGFWRWSILAVVFSCRADQLVLPPADVDLVGEMREVTTLAQDTLADVARQYGLGRGEIISANPGVDPWLPGADTRIILPTRYVLPAAPREGIVLNLPEMRLYFFPPAQKDAPRLLVTHPVSIGRMDWKTPLGTTRIVAKQRDPIWHPPASVKEEAVANGRELAPSVPPGPDNPLGRFAMRLAVPGYLMHGTNKPYGLGMRVTHGCIRLYPEDIEQLFFQVPVGTEVQIVNQPVKLGWLAGTLFMEVHPPLEEDVEARENLLRHALELVYAERERIPFVVDGALVRQTVQNQSGIPVAVSRRPLSE